MKWSFQTVEISISSRIVCDANKNVTVAWDLYQLYETVKPFWISMHDVYLYIVIKKKKQTYIN